jgi:pyrroline-5-carboxylate reductase
MAQRMALQMVLGAAQLAAQSDYTPSELARRVTSPGGTTAAGLDKLDENGALGALLKSTLRAARDRGADLAQKAKGESGT